MSGNSAGHAGPSGALRQTVDGKKDCTPEQALTQLKSSKRKWEQSFEAVISKKTMLCVLSCRSCNAELSVSNTSTAAKQHLNASPVCGAQPSRVEWGRMYTSQRSTLGLDKARKLIAMKHYLRPDSDGSEEEAEIALGHLA
jgi:hypothetical protein